MNLVKIAEVRRTMEIQLDRLKELEQEMQSAKPPKQPQIRAQINLIAQDIRNLNTILQHLVESTW